MAVLASVLLLAVGCSNSDARKDLDLGPDSSAELTVGGDETHPLRLSLEPGDLASTGTVEHSSSPLEPPTAPGFRPAGSPVDVSVDARIRQPLTMSFAAGDDHPDDVPVIWHHDGETWSVVAAGEAGGTALAERESFSPFQAGWFQPSAWSAGVAGAVGRWASGGTTAPECSSPPDWADLSPAPLDILLSCVDGVGGKAVLRAKVNRGLPYLLDLDPGLKDVTVDGQPAVVRELVRTITGTANGVVVGPGTTVTVTSARPAAQATEVTLRPQLTELMILVALLNELTGLVRPDDSLALLAGMKDLRECAGLSAYFGMGVLASNELDAAKALVSGLAACLVNLADNPVLITEITYRALSLRTGLSVDQLDADRRYTPQAEQISGKLLTAGHLVKKALNVVWVTQLATVVYRAAAEEAGRAQNPHDDPARVRLTLRTAPPPLAELLAAGKAACAPHKQDDDDCDARRASPRISSVDGRFGHSGPFASAYGGSVFRRDSLESRAWTPVYALGGGVDACSEIEGVPGAVLRELELCINDLTLGAQPVSPTRLGPLRIGMTLAEAKAELPVEKSGAACPGSGADPTLESWSYTGGEADVTLLARKGRLVAVLISDSRIRIGTGRGVGIGDGLSAVRAAFPGLTSVEDPPGAFLASGGDVLHFRLLRFGAEPQVDAIGIGDRQLATAYEVCG